MKLTKDIMFMALTLQKLKAFRVAQHNATTNNSINWFSDCKVIFHTSQWKADISLNEHNFQVLLDFKITEEMDKTPAYKLGKFDIDIWGDEK